MGFLQILGIGSVFAAVLLAGFMHHVKKDMEGFRINFSQTAGKVILITGANSGLGYYTALALAKAEAQVILACRSTSKCEEAQKSILKEVPSGKVDHMTVDLSSFASIRQFANDFKEKYDHLDVLVNNAGIMALPAREVTKDGLEAQIGTNHFGHFLLTALLYPIISENGRIINHSSMAYAFAAKNFVSKDLFSENFYDPWVAYGNSKIANLFFTYELNRRLELQNNPKNIISVAVHPGYTATNLQTGRFPMWEQFNAAFAMKGPDGALSQTYAAVDPNVKASKQDIIGPQYLSLGKPTLQKTSNMAWDIESHQQLWTISEKLVGETLLE